MSIPDNFLREAPNASLRILDFQTTTPPIPAYKDHFAAVIDNFMTPDECTQLLHLANTQNPTNWARAKVNAGNGKEVMEVDTRNCGRIIWDSPDLADRILHRLRPFIEQCGIQQIQNQPLVTGRGPAKRGEVVQVSRLNERFRFLRYEGGEYFRPHWDGSYVTPDGERSLYTIHLYLNGSGEQDIEELEKEIEKAERKNGLFAEDGEIDLEEVGQDEESDEVYEDGELLGGATSFTDGYDATDAVRVFPKTGSVLIFQQRNLFHGGDDVFRGVKYTVRTDVLYRE
ncbi:hypothetical protein ASPWEDRAFT_169776 [Aspergillus wentii DTO 134E9]|uniref:Prolyl 4-hydroxylase alpha subunit domain-containing protein n=1 Tax=Aspergillus wentii DTO 134E9 TaxID=1073089 RepID=A0A1L9RYG5_ASPWE|nr:uncharacterized protein ASPWEDRAFT_169776 [Aspergillus wentii DTO 134E9]KAI9931381.1 hypothetical protein MW887_009956 [Aspergillus wentii]OJJ39952.1 hypothetical protein ASPWEDRAFT_169776 [Aspergillus wentii DTO 134E9]